MSVSLMRNFFGSELSRRVIVGVPAAAVALFLNNQGGLVWAAALLVFGGLCLSEFNRLTEPAGQATIFVMPISFGVLAGMLAAALYGPLATVLLVFVAAIPLLFFAVAFLGLHRSASGLGLSTLAPALLGICWIGIPLACAVYLRGLPHGEVLVIDVMVVAFVGDTAAYLGGKKFGATHPVPHISPGKTFEGWWAGFLTSLVVLAYIAGQTQHWLTLGKVLAFGAPIALVAPLGDLFESFFKRDINVKDSGGIFGAHGGALDRADAALWAAVVGCTMAIILGL